MDEIKQHIEIILGERLEDYPYLKANVNNTEKDKKGSSSTSFANCKRYISVASYMLNKDLNTYYEKIKQSVKIYISLFRRFENGEPISKSYVSILRYKELFDALATGDMELSNEYAQLLGGRLEIEKEFDHPFDIALGYALKAIVLDTDDVTERLQAFRDQLSNKGNKSFKGFVEAFEAIYHRDSEAFEKGLNEIVNCYPHLRKGVFDHSLDAHLCVWGLGLINLAKHKGMTVEFDHELMPKELQVG